MCPSSGLADVVPVESRSVPIVPMAGCLKRKPSQGRLFFVIVTASMSPSAIRLAFAGFARPPLSPAASR